MADALATQKLLGIPHEDQVIGKVRNGAPRAFILLADAQADCKHKARQDTPSQCLTCWGRGHLDSPGARVPGSKREHSSFKAAHLACGEPSFQVRSLIPKSVFPPRPEIRHFPVG